ncbi:MAG: TetR/AcrR family transcriptional regulator [Methylomonas sp.]|jgi:AcrR family transcriptional regulator|uniref:TetR/AcrR family transcriptional regulator n=1 Tax=Methylomonas sp. TaxID=418 RepID=UPI0025F262AB|nr:TetR/AcrR family transcriptional regulator [Methylomonas sp.]MCK9609410.1 TetR/AcrR family transcriptional regulator [Methylomonas sp.]
MTPIIETSDKPPRERILLTAHDLFYSNGIRATGIDKVIAEAGVSKVTFYRNFPSKNALILAFLDYRHQRWISWFRDALQRQSGCEGQGLMCLVPVLEEWFDKPLFRGCAFINTAAEFADSFPEALEVCRRHKQDMVGIIAELLPVGEFRFSLANAAAVAVDGAIVRAQLETQSPDIKTALAGLALILSTFDRVSETAYSSQPTHQ